MFLKKFIFILCAASSLCTMGFSAQDVKGQVGIVNFSTCLLESKYGKQEQNSLESLKKQLSSLLEDTEKQLNEIGAKFNDAEYMDGLSPEAEEELKNKFTSLNQEMHRYQNQYYQVLNQANMKMLHLMSTHIQTASENIAKDKKLSMVINKEACFFYVPGLDVTNLVVAEMDKSFEQDAVKKTQVSQDSANGKGTSGTGGK